MASLQTMFLEERPLYFIENQTCTAFPSKPHYTTLSSIVPLQTEAVTKVLLLHMSTSRERLNYC